MEINASQSKNFLYNLLKIRLVDEYIADVYPTDVIKCPIHLSIGSEAVSVGICSALKKTDMVIGGHRGHGIYLAKGGDLNEFMAEMYGRETGCSGGKGGSMHLISLENGLLGTTPILGSTIPIGVGAALSSKLKKNGKLTAIFFGDGASEEGVYYESLNLAALYKLPVIFVCENNKYSIFQDLKARQPVDNLYKKGEAFGISGERVDGNNVEDVFLAAKRAVKVAKSGKPYLIECVTNRWRQHVGPFYDHEIGFGTKEEIEKIMLNEDPIANLLKKAKKAGFFDDKFVEKTRKRIIKEVTNSIEFANKSPLPSVEKLYSHIY